MMTAQKKAGLPRDPERWAQGVCAEGHASVVGFGSAQTYVVRHEHGQGRNVTAVSVEWMEDGQ